MKKTYLFSILFVASFIFNSCEKGQSHYTPKIESVEAHILTDQRIWLEMDLAYGSFAHQFGFCMDTLPNPSLEKNQLWGQIGQQTSQMIYSEFNPNKENYIRPWAAHDYGYSYGAEFKVSELNPVYSSFHDEINANTWLDGYHDWQSIDSVTGPVQDGTRWHIYAYTATTQIKLSFRNLIEGAYVTKAYGQKSYLSEVTVEFTIDGRTYIPYGNGLIELKKVNATQWSIIIPDAWWKANHLPQLPLIGHILTP